MAPHEDTTGDRGADLGRRRLGRHLLAAGGAAAAATATAAALAPAAGAAGVAFHAITPYRSIDTRDFGLGPFPSGQPLDVDVWTDVAATPMIPREAAAVTFNLTVTETVGSGFLAVHPAGTAYPGTSTINWSGGDVTVANGGTVALGSSDGVNGGTVTVVAGGGGAAQFILDVTGYYA